MSTKEMSKKSLLLLVSNFDQILLKKRRSQTNSIVLCMACEALLNVKPDAIFKFLWVKPRTPFNSGRITATKIIQLKTGARY